jgi:thiamine-monophosphate kinase
VRESDLHQRIFALTRDMAQDFPHVLIGPGDDCALVRTPDGGTLLLKVDQVIEHRHFHAGTSVDLIARKAIARAVSDIAAMAGTPAWGLASAILPQGDARAPQLCDRLHHWARAFACPLVGGDIASGPPGCALSLSITVGGTPAPGRGPVTRSGAKPGDHVYVSGRIGNSLASGRHLTFEPRVALARRLADTLVSDLHAMIDVSDGLGRDAARLAERSSVRIILDAASIPLHEHVSDPVQACADGEDYELLFTAAPGAAVDPDCTRIGRVEPGRGCVLVTPTRQIDAHELGWDH